MGEKLPQQAADEGRACRKSPFTGRQRHSRPSSGIASLSHLPPWGKAFWESPMSNYNPYTKRQTMIAPDYEVYRYRSTYMNEVELHHHDFYEVYLLLRGRVEYIVENQL